MAMDTAAKRKSAIGIGLLCLRLGVVPDNGNLSGPQRQHVSGLYSGIATAGAVAGAALDGLVTAQMLTGLGR